jgi:Lon protease-like protein
MIEIVPVFPLPNAVLFPRTRLPLHVFEPRYRAMMRDALAGERRMAVALLRPGFEDDYEGSPDFCSIATVGRVEDARELPDGRFTLTLVGESRVELREIPSERLYRIARADPRPETRPAGDSSATQREKVELLTAHGYLLRELSDAGAPGIVLDDRMPFEEAVNATCANLPVEPGLRQELLEIDDLHRRAARAAKLIDEVLEAVIRLKSDLRGSEMN